MLDVIIIGSGFGGITSAILLKKRNIQNFILLERDEEMGGTWWRNSYPGAAVDVQSQLYSISFEPYNWTRLFAEQAELLEYTNHVIDKYQLREKCTLNTPVTKLQYNETKGTWTVYTATEKTYEARFIINASGGLSQAKIPNFEGKDTFEGKRFHTNRWDHSYDYTNKKVAIIGTGASAVQTIPTIAPKVKQLHVFQRTPHWVLPRPDRKLTSFERKIVEYIPSTAWLFREFTFWRLEWRVLAFRYNPKLLNIFALKAKRNISKGIKDSELQKKVTPNYIMGCKRILISNTYYPSLERANVCLHTAEDGVKSINKNGIQTQRGEQIDLDLIIYATGFHASENQIHYPVIGKGGMPLSEKWKDGASAYLGTTIPYFPNFFMLAGPNTGTGHISALHFIESQLIYVMRMIDDAHKNGWKSFEIKTDVEQAYNEKVQQELSGTVWQTGGCKSWYQMENGKNTTLYPGFATSFRNRIKKITLDDHLIKK